jgi:hypothetical protein
MRLHIGISVALLLASSAFGQNRFGTPSFNSFGTPVLIGGFGNAVFPAGTPANSPNITRFNSNAVFPGGGGPRLVIPGRRPNRFTGSPIVAVPSAFPVYVGGSGFDSSYGQPPVQQQPPPNVTVVYPPQPAPVIVSQFGQGGQGQPATNAPTPGPGPQSLYQPDQSQPDQSDQSDPDHFLIALKDHTVYSVVAYWADGDTLHYFTAGNVHNQVSLSLVDRALTSRLNRESGVEVKLPDDK